MIRLWQGKGKETPTTWRGEIESIQSGRKWQFADLEMMCDFLKAQVFGESAVESDRERA